MPSGMVSSPFHIGGQCMHVFQRLLQYIFQSSGSTLHVVFRREQVLFRQQTLEFGRRQLQPVGITTIELAGHLLQVRLLRRL